MPIQQSSLQQPQSRGQAFGEGIAASPGLQESAMRLKAAVPMAYQSTGSPNGIGVQQYQNTMGGYLKPQNGVATDNYQNSQGGGFTGRFKSGNGTSNANFQSMRFTSPGLSRGM